MTDDIFVVTTVEGVSAFPEASTYALDLNPNTPSFLSILPSGYVPDDDKIAVFNMDYVVQYMWVSRDEYEELRIEA
jgi:hypothetical protein